MANRGVTDADSERFDYGLESALHFDTGGRRSGVYVDIVSSGQANLLRDPNLRAALSRYDELHQKANFLFQQFWQAQRIHEVAFSRHFQYENTRRLIGEIFVPGSIVGYDLAAMADDAEFQLAAQRLIESQVYYQIWHLQMQHAAREVFTLLESARAD